MKPDFTNHDTSFDYDFMPDYDKRRNNIMTVRDAKKMGLFDLMPNGFDIYDYKTNKPITDDLKSLLDAEIMEISGGFLDIVPIIYISQVKSNEMPTM